jgi:O-antigen ligase
MLADRLPLRLTLLAGLALLAVLPAYISYLTFPTMPLLLAAAGVYLVLACGWPGWAVPIGCALAPLEAVQLPLAGLGALSATESAFLVLAIGWFWRALTRPETVVFPSIADFPIIAFILALLPGIAIGADIAVVGKLMVMWTAFYFVYLTVRGLRPHEIRRVLWALGSGAAVLGVTGVLAYVSGGGAQLSQGGISVSGRASGGIADPNYYAAYLQLAGVPLLAIAVARITRRRALAFSAVGAVALGILLSLSRGGTLGLLLAVTVVVLSWSRTRWVTAAVLVVLLGTTAFNLNPLVSGEVTEVVSERFATTTASSSNNQRLLLWEKSLGVIDDHKAFGVGALQFKNEANRLGLTQRGSPLQNVHNIPLNIAVELGLLGLAAYLLWLGRIARDVVVEIRRRRRASYGIAVGLGAALLGYAVQGLTVSQYQVQVIQATFFVLAGVAAAARGWDDDVAGREGSAGSARPVAALDLREQVGLAAAAEPAR